MSKNLFLDCIQFIKKTVPQNGKISVHHDFIVVGGVFNMYISGLQKK